MPMHRHVRTHYYPFLVLFFLPVIRDSWWHNESGQRSHPAAVCALLHTLCNRNTWANGIFTFGQVDVCWWSCIFVNFLSLFPPQVTALLGNQHWPDAVLLKKRLSPAGGNQALMAACPPPMPCTTAKKSEFLLLLYGRWGSSWLYSTVCDKGITDFITFISKSKIRP